MEGQSLFNDKMISNIKMEQESEKLQNNLRYGKAYKRMHARIKYGMLTKEEFKKWNMKAIEKTQLCEDENLPEDKRPSLEELKEWLGNK